MAQYKSKQPARNEQLSDRYLEIPEKMLKFRSWPVGGIDSIRRIVRCVSYSGRPRVKGRSESCSRLSGPPVIGR